MLVPFFFKFVHGGARGFQQFMAAGASWPVFSFNSSTIGSFLPSGVVLSNLTAAGQSMVPA